MDAALDVVRSGDLGAGEATAAFEEAFAAHLGVRHVVAVASCTTALHLALLGLGVGPGDEVIVPSYTFVATAAAVRYCGAEPVFADVVGPRAPSLDPERVAALLTPRTRAVICVHFAGYAAAVHELRALCDAHGAALVEDAAHAPAARSTRGAALGSVGAVGCFSLFTNKVLSVGEGGMLSTDDPAIAAFARSPPPGFGARIDDPRSALASSRLGGLTADVAHRRRLTHRYRALLADVEGVTLPFAAADVDDSSCYVMPVMLEDPALQVGVRTGMSRRHAVQTSLLYPAIHEFTAYRDRRPRLPLPQTERCARSEITLPLFPHMTPGQQDRVVTALDDELRRAGR